LESSIEGPLDLSLASEEVAALPWMEVRGWDVVVVDLGMKGIG
jgi:hypothetical protein